MDAKEKLEVALQDYICDKMQQISGAMPRTKPPVGFFVEVIDQIFFDTNKKVLEELIEVVKND